MQVDTNLIWQPFNTLSGGEQTKVLLALSFINKDAFPLIDEPTNHLDEKSRIQVVRYLQKHSQGYIVVSHDRDFLNQITNHILAIEHTEIHLYQEIMLVMKILKKSVINLIRRKMKNFVVKLKL